MHDVMIIWYSQVLVKRAEVHVRLSITGTEIRPVNGKPCALTALKQFYLFYLKYNNLQLQTSLTFPGNS